MGCGCNRKKPDVSLNVISPQDIAASCQLCPHSKKDQNGNAIICSVSKKQIVTISREPKPTCPIGNFYADKIEKEWLGLTWLGIPFPQRFLLSWKLKRNPIGLSGCGCVKVLKEKYTGKFYSEISGVFSDAMNTIYFRFGEFAKDYKSVFN